MAKFQIGHQKHGGRKPGIPNKRFASAEIILEEIGINPLEELAKISMDLGCDVNTRLNALKELAQYCFPKRKAVEHSHSFNEDQTSELSDDALEEVIIFRCFNIIDTKIGSDRELSEDQKTSLRKVLLEITKKN